MPLIIFNILNDTKAIRSRQMLPQAWYENGRQLEIVANRLAYFRAGLSRSPEFHPYAWHGIGEALQEQGDMSGAAQAFANEERTRQGLATIVSPQLQESVTGSKSLADKPRFCPACGAAIIPMAQYCAHCGEPLKTVELERPIQTSQNFQDYPQGNQQDYPSSYLRSQGNGFGLAGLIMAIIGFFIASVPLGLVALVLGGVGSRKDRTKNFAIGALCVGAIDFIVGLILFAMNMSYIYY